MKSRPAKSKKMLIPAQDLSVLPRWGAGISSASRPEHSAIASSVLVILVVIMTLCPSMHMAQDDWDTECDTYLTPAQLDRIYQRGDAWEEYLPFKTRGLYTYPWYIPIKIHIIRDDFGQGGISVADAVAVIEDCNQLLDGSNADFRVYKSGDIHFIDNKFWTDVEGEICDGGSNHLGTCTGNEDCPGGGVCTGKAKMLKNIANDPSACDVYFVWDFGKCGSGSPPGGPAQGIVINLDCDLYYGILAHELGHYFDLAHTHSSGECPDGSNCGSTGDHLCDTPADPNLSGAVDNVLCVWNRFTCNDGSNQGKPCADGSDCPGGDCTDEATPPAGCDQGVPYDPMVNNMMSYAPRECRDAFTDDQRGVMHYTWVNLRRNLFNLTEYVDGIGAKEPDGSPDLPFETIAEAVDAASAGDQVIIKAGTYNEPMIIGISPIKSLTLRKWDEVGSNVVIGKGGS